MAKAMLQSGGGGGIGRKTAVKTEKPKRLSKAGEWILAHPHGVGGVIYCDRRALMK